MFLSRIRQGMPSAILRTKEILTSNKQHIRCLYSGEELGVKSYQEARKVVEHAIANQMFFKTQFRKQLNNPDFNLTHLEYGLKNLLHIMTKNHNDIIILKEALKTLICRQKEYEGDKYRFDTIIMRAFYFLNMPDHAIEFFEDNILGQLFTQVTSYQILLDLLYESERYEDVLRIYEHLMENGRLHRNKYIDVIVLATYYRMNTPDALENAYALWTQLTEVGNKVQFRKSRTFVAGLAVKQFQPELALQILEGETTYVTMRHIKQLAWAQLGQFDKIFEMFGIVLKRHHNEKNYEPLTSISVLNDIERSIKTRGSEKDSKEFHEIRKKLESMELVTKKSLDDLLCSSFPVLPQAQIYHKKTERTS